MYEQVYEGFLNIGARQINRLNTSLLVVMCAPLLVDRIRAGGDQLLFNVS